MSYPAMIRMRTGETESIDLEPGRIYLGVLMGVGRRAGVWGPIHGEVATLAIDQPAGATLLVPLVTQELVARFRTSPPQLGSVVTLRCSGLLVLEFKFIGQTTGALWDVEEDPPPELDSSAPDERTEWLPLDLMDRV